MITEGEIPIKGYKELTQKYNSLRTLQEHIADPTPLIEEQMGKISEENDNYRKEMEITNYQYKISRPSVNLWSC